MEDKVIKYLLENCKGYNKRKKSIEIMKYLNINDNKSLRRIIEKIRQDNKNKIFICSEAGHKGGYWIAKDYREIDQTIEHLEKRAYEMLKTAKILRKKVKKRKFWW